MDPGARVRSLDAIERFKAALSEFGEVSNRALSEAESDVQRTIFWLKHDQAQHWQRTLKKRRELLANAKSELYRAKLSASNEPRSTMTERKLVEKAERALEEAEQKLEATKKWAAILEREFILFKGQCQQLGHALASELPMADARLKNMIRTIDEYVHIAPPRTDMKGLGDENESDQASSARPPGELTPVRPGLLRQAAPRQSVRDALSIDEAPPSRQDETERDVIDLPASLEPDSPDEDTRVVVGQGALEADRCFLERSPSIVPGDSGWYLGAVRPDASIPKAEPYRTYRLGDLCAARPELAALLTLPRGFLAVVHRGQIERIWNERDRDARDSASPPTQTARSDAT